MKIKELRMTVKPTEFYGDGFIDLDIEIDTKIDKYRFHQTLPPDHLDGVFDRIFEQMKIKIKKTFFDNGEGEQEI